MKRFIFILCAIFICTFAFAQTIRWHVGDSIIRTDTCSSGDSVTPPTAPAKTGWHFVEWKKMYTKIEYLETSNGSTINTGFIPLNTDGLYIKIVFEIVSFNGVASGIWGYMDASALPRFSLFITGNNQPFGFGLNATNYFDMKSLMGIKYTAELDDGLFRLSNANMYETRNIPLSSTNQTIYPIYVGSRGYKNGETGWPSNIKIYSFEIIQGNLHLDLIPVLDKNGVPCMFDKVTGQFFYNQGTGQFIAGPVINE